MRIAFLGTPDSAVFALEALLAAGHEVSLVVTRPDRPVRRSGKPLPPPVKLAALRRSLPVEQPTRIRSPRFMERLREAAPEALVVVAYGKILPQAVFSLPPHGSINLHFSLLPRYRGAAPVQWALARGERVTGVTTMQIAEGLDEGDILLQEEVAVEPGEHAPALTSRLATVGATLLVRTLAALSGGRLEPRPQRHDRATLAPLLTREDGSADFRLEAREIEGRIRGFDPWPGVWAVGNGRRIRLLEGRALEVPAGGADPPGRVLALTGDGLVVACGAGTRLGLARLQPEGRKPVAARDAVNGRVLRPGDLLGGPGAG